MKRAYRLAETNCKSLKKRIKNGGIRVVIARLTRRRRIICLLPLFLAAVAIVFLLEFSTYKSPNFFEVHRAISGMRKLNFTGNEPIALTEQFGNETKIAEITALWETPTLLNLTFKWLLNNEDICKPRRNEPEDRRLMPVLVHTARPHFQERLALRRTWGSIPVYKKWVLRVIFLLGEADRGSNPGVNQKQFEEQEKQLQEENEKFGDLVIGNFTDSYYNLTYKHLMGYKWILNYCPEATFVLKIDDDMFIDIMRWFDWRSKDLETIDADKSAIIPEYYCYTIGGSKPIRVKGSKWYVSFEDWPEDYYPDYCSGWAYAISLPLMQKVYSLSNDIEYFWVDDVFVSGALIEVVQMKYQYKPEVRHLVGELTVDIKDYRGLCESQSWNDTRKFKAVAYVPRGIFFDRDMICMWNKTLHDSSYLENFM